MPPMICATSKCNFFCFFDVCKNKTNLTDRENRIWLIRRAN
jgi:hypothetical protein